MKNRFFALKGFTLVELLVVIAIIGLLSTLAVVSLNSARARARDSKRASDVYQFQRALELYYNDNSGYPAGPGGTFKGFALGFTDAQAPASFKGATSLTNSGFITTAPAPGAIVYMKSVPRAPQPGDGKCASGNYDILAGPKSEYLYDASNPNDHLILFCLGQATGSTKAGQNEITPQGLTWISNN